MPSRPEDSTLSAPDIDRVLREGDAWLAGQLASSRQTCFVIGLSGGIDSAVTALWAVRAVGQSRVILASLPYGLRGPCRFPASHPA